MAGYTHAGRQVYFRGSIDRRRAYPVAARAPTGLDWLDCALIGLFLLGLYTNYTIQISAKVPFPSMPSGVAGLLLLWRRRDLMKPSHVAGLVSVLALYLMSILCATNIAFLPRRTNGLIQLTYSITIGYEEMARTGFDATAHWARTALMDMAGRRRDGAVSVHAGHGRPSHRDGPVRGHRDGALVSRANGACTKQPFAHRPFWRSEVCAIPPLGVLQQ